MLMSNIEETVSKCLSCPIPQCAKFCPCGNDIRDFIKALKDGDEEKAGQILYAKNPFPELTSWLCDHARQCAGHCVKARMGQGVDVPSVEAYLASTWPRPVFTKPHNGKSVAIVGAGPASLSAAYFLAREGYRVQAYEKQESIGGAILSAIPSFRFDKQKLGPIYEDLKEMGIVFHFGYSVNEETLSSLRKENDYVILAFGAEKENRANLGQGEGIVGGLDYLKGKQSINPSIKKAFVYGGGNVAMDCARSLLREGKEVTIIYRRSRKEMPASAKEVEEALQEGAKLLELHSIKETIVSDGRLSSLRLITMELGEPDESGRASFHEAEGSEETVEASCLVYAIGEKPDPSELGAFEVGESQKTSLPNVYVIGDARLGAKNIATAIKEGRECAETIIGK